MRSIIIGGAAAMLLSGCGTQPDPQQNSAGVSDNAAAAAPSTDVPDTGNQAASLSEADRADAKQAAQTLQQYFALIASGDAGDAEQLWQQGAENRQRFGDAIDRYPAFRFDIGEPGPPRGDAEAGRQIEIPLILIAADSDGKQIRREGRALLTETSPQSWRIATIEFLSRPRQSPPASEAVTRTLNCVDGSSFTVTFDPVSKQAVVRQKDKVVATLDVQPAETGVYYRSGEYVLRGQGNRVVFSRPDSAPLPCRAS